jgi:hypothetical protein
VRDLSDELSKIKSKQNTWDRFPQRAPNLYVANKEENVDPTHPLVLRFPIPTQVLKTTRVLLSLRGLALQYFSQVSGASSISTSAAGGNSTETASWFAFLQRILETVAIEDPGVAYDQHTHKFVLYGTLFEHDHTVSIPAHTHGMAHTHLQSLDYIRRDIPQRYNAKN